MITGQQQQPPFHSASLYVGDLDPLVAEGLLFEIFNAVGPVASIRVCRDTVTRRSLGYAYVNFHNLADAERSLDAMNYTPIKGRPCRIMWSQRDPGLRKSGVGNIFVKNLSPSIDHKALYDTFSLFGNILSCKVAQDSNGVSKGYGYVHYETAESANDAIAKTNGNVIADQVVYVGHFQRRTERPGNNDWTNCYVKNIPDEWDTEKLKAEFGKYGEVSSAVVMKGPSKKKEEGGDSSRGFGFVSFATHEGAAAAVEALNGQKVGPEGAERELYVGRAQKRSERERELKGKFEALRVERQQKYQGVNLYVKHLDDAVDDDALRSEFAPFGTITSAHVMKNEGGAPAGFGFVCFSSPEEANKAVAEMNGKLIHGKPVFVALAQRRDVRRAQLEAHHAQRSAGMGMGRGVPMGQPPMYGAAPMYFPGQPQPMPPQARGNFMYPQAMMARGPRGPMAYGRGGPGGYQMPQYNMGMPPQQAQAVDPQQMQQQQPRGGPRPGRGGRPNAPQQMGNQAPQQAGGRGGQGNRNFKYNSNVRNQPQQQVMQQAPPQQQAPGMEPLTPAALAAASPDMQKNMIGERLYPLVHMVRPELAGKITGMLLEMDNGELLHLLESPEDLNSKIDEAVRVLKMHEASE